MGYIITDFKKWKPLLEQKENFVSPGRTKQTAGIGQRVVAVPIKSNAFKVKIIRDLDIIGKDGRVKTPGMNSVIKWLRTQIKWPKSYPGLMDLKSNFILYTVKKDNKRAQIITCTLVSRKDPDYKGVPEDQNYVEAKELSSLTPNNSDHTNILSDLDNTHAGKEADDDIDDLIANILDEPILLTKINSIKSDSKLFDLIDKVYIKFLDIPQIAKLDFMEPAEQELRSKVLGVNIMKMLNGIIAGFDIKDKYRKLEKSITENVVRRLIQIVGKNSLNESITNDKIVKKKTTIAKPNAGFEIRDFNIKAFTAIVQPKAQTKEEKVTSVVDLIDKDAAKEPEVAPIKIPEGGLKKDPSMKVNTTLQQIQNLIITTFDKKLASSGLFAKFKKYGADGKYGPTTETMVAALKAGYGMKDQTGTIITKPFLDNVVGVDINESVLTLDYRLLEKFDVSAFVKMANSYVVQSTAKKPVAKAAVPAKEVAKPVDPKTPGKAFVKAIKKEKATKIPGTGFRGAKM